MAIAKGDVPARHWFRLGRAVTPIAHGAALISWSGSMFEYLMPSLVMRAPAGSLLEQTSRLIVRRQIDYGAKLGRALGHLGIRLQRPRPGVHLPVLELRRAGPRAEARPWRERRRCALCDGARSDGRSRRGSAQFRARSPRSARAAATASTRRWITRRAAMPEGESVAIVRAFMAHHQGMTIVAIANALLDGAMRARFHAEPMVQATELLLQERTPRDVAVVRPWAEEAKAAATVRSIERADGAPAALTAQARRPHAPALERPLRGDADGCRLRLQPLATISPSRVGARTPPATTGAPMFSCATSRSGDVWSAGYQPSGAEPDSYDVMFNEDRAEFIRRDGTLTTTLEVLVSAEDDAEVRRISIANAGDRVREIEVTSYAELVLAPQAADVAHPAFSKLFVADRVSRQASAPSWRRGGGARRPSPKSGRRISPSSKVKTVGEPEIETDRARFLGRGRERPHADRGDRRPAALQHGRHRARSGLRAAPPCAGRTRRDACDRPSGRVVAIFARGCARPRRQASRRAAFERAATLALDPGAGAAPSSRRRSRARRPVPACRRPPALRRTGAAASSEAIRRGAGGQPGSGLWASPATCPSCCCGSPISRISISSRQLLRAHEYWRMKQLAVDLVILNERASSYIQDLQIALETAVRTSQSRPKGRERETGGPCIRASRRSDFGRGARTSPIGGAGRAGRTSRKPRRSARPSIGDRAGRPHRSEASCRWSDDAGRSRPAGPRVFQRTGWVRPER